MTAELDGRGWAASGGLAIVVALLARWVVLPLVLGSAGVGPTTRTMLVVADYGDAVMIVLGVVAVLIAVAAEVRNRYGPRDDGPPRWFAEPLVLALGVIVALFVVAVLEGTALAPLVVHQPAAAAFFDRLALVAVAVATAGVVGLGVVGAVLMVTGKPTPSITALRPGRPGQDIRASRRSIRRGK